MEATAALSLTAGPLVLRLGDAALVAGLGAHRLRLAVQTEARWLDADEPKDTAVAFLQGFVWLDQPMTAIGPINPQVLTVRGYAVNEVLSVTLTDDQLRAVNAARGPGDLALRLDLQGALISGAGAGLAVASTQVGHRVAAAQWLAMLDQAGALVSVSIRVPSPFTRAASGTLPSDDAGLTQAAERLRQARDHLENGRPSECVMSCRLALDNLVKLRSLPAVGPVPSKRGPDERWAALHQAVYSLASATGHDDDITDSFTWSRTDAEAVLAAAAGLVARFRL